MEQPNIDTLYSIIIAEFGTRTPIRSIYSYIHDESKFLTHYVDLVCRLSLQNVHRLSSDGLVKPITLHFIENTYHFAVDSIIFQVTPGQTQEYYSTNIVYPSPGLIEKKMRENVSQLTVKYMKLTEFFIQQGNKSESFNRLKPIFLSDIDELTFLLKHFENHPLPPFSPFDTSKAERDSFYSLALTSHLQTQCNTVIEGLDSEVPQLLSFLSHYIISNSRPSSFEILPTVHPQLQLQWVENQQNIEEIILHFDHPITWIKFPERIVFQTPTQIDQKSIYDEFFLAQTQQYFERSDDQSGLQKRISKLKSSCKLTLVNTPAPWAANAVSDIANNPKSRMLLVKQQVTRLVRTCVAFSAMVSDQKKLVRGLTSEVILTIMSNLSLTPEDQTLLISMTSILDPQIRMKLQK